MPKKNSLKKTKFSSDLSSIIKNSEKKKKKKNSGRLIRALDKIVRAFSFLQPDYEETFYKSDYGGYRFRDPFWRKVCMKSFYLFKEYKKALHTF